MQHVRRHLHDLDSECFLLGRTLGTILFLSLVLALAIRKVKVEEKTLQGKGKLRIIVPSSDHLVLHFGHSASESLFIWE